MNIENIKLEFLRPGPAHNHLLSPLTPYIALCGREGLATVNFPFEQRQLLTRLERLRYISPSGVIPAQQREAEVQEMGEIIGEVLGKVPALATQISKVRTESEGLVHLRLSLSAYELALVPFEFAIAPNGFPGSGSPLFLQCRVPVTLTREVRRDRPLPVFWNRPPRILFAFANPASLAPVPAQDHLEALRRAIDPWVKWRPTPEDRAEEVKSLITVLPDATLENIRQACAEKEYTYVHILAHGGPMVHGIDQQYGLALCGQNNADEIDMVDGEQLALTLTASTSAGSTRHRPALVSLATCDSGNVGSVITPGASIAHQLHASGIPWVIASQFPLHMRASSIAAEVLSKGLLQGEDPRWVLYDVRQRLRTNSPGTHDWGSIVAYASVPWDFERQVEAFRNRQIRTKLDVKFDKAEQVLEASAKTTSSPPRGARPVEFAELKSLYDSIRQDLAMWLDDLPPTASKQERAERLGMSGASEKRIGILYRREGDKQKEEERKAYVASCDYYRRALAADPVNHWVMTQYLSMRAVLAGKEGQKSLAREYRDWWITARQIALWELPSTTGVDKAWAHGTLAELEMLAPIYSLGKMDRKEVKRRIVEHCRAICDLAIKDSFPVYSTRRQFQRYLDVWKREEWQDLAAAAVEALSQGEPQAPGVYLGPGKT